MSRGRTAKGQDGGKGKGSKKDDGNSKGEEARAGLGLGGGKGSDGKSEKNEGGRKGRGATLFMKGKKMGKTEREFQDAEDPYASFPFVFKLAKVRSWTDPEEPVNKVEACDTSDGNEEAKRRRIAVITQDETETGTKEGPSAL